MALVGNHREFVHEYSVSRGAYKIPNPSNATSPTFTRTFTFRFQNIHVENTARYRSVAELKASRVVNSQFSVK